MVTVPESLEAERDEVEIVAGSRKRRENVQGGDKGTDKNSPNGVLDIGHGSSRLRGRARRAKGQEVEEGEMVEEKREEENERETGIAPMRSSESEGAAAGARCQTG